MLNCNILHCKLITSLFLFCFHLILFCKVLEVVTLRREGLRGQAWILFDDLSSAISAQRTENGFVFFGKALKVQFARETSDRIAKRDGTYIPKDRRLKQKQAVMSSNTTTTTSITLMEGDSSSSQHPPTSTTSSQPPASSSIPPPPPSTMESTQQPASSSTSLPEPAPPSNILFAQNLPEECNEMMLAMLFRQYVGYQQIRMPRKGLAFVEFESEPNATLALKGLNGFQITSKDTLNLEYSR